MYLRKYIFEDMLYYKIDSRDLKNLMETSEAVVIDVRSRDEFKKEHIPSAINIPLEEITDSLSTLSLSERTCVIYCEGIGSNDAIKAAIKLSNMNFYTKILIGGIEWWKKYNFQTINSKNNK